MGFWGRVGFAGTGEVSEYRTQSASPFLPHPIEHPIRALAVT